MWPVTTSALGLGRVKKFSSRPDAFGLRQDMPIFPGRVFDMQVTRNRRSREQGREIRSALCRCRRGVCRAFEGWIVAKHKHDDGSNDSAA
jgi:hypothetical protein